jgi:hypothetical protein
MIVFLLPVRNSIKNAQKQKSQFRSKDGLNIHFWPLRMAMIKKGAYLLGIKTFLDPPKYSFLTSCKEIPSKMLRNFSLSTNLGKGKNMKGESRS